MSSKLFSLRNQFYIGNYQQSINEGSLKLKSPKEKLERDFYVYRSYIGLGNYQMVLNSVSESDPLELKVIKLYASLLNNPEENTEVVLDTLKGWLTEIDLENDYLFQIMAATIYSNTGNYDEALRVLSQTNELETSALKIQIYLLINRQDKAIEELDTIRKINEDATIYQLASNWIELSSNNEQSIQKALESYNELGQIYGKSISILNAIAVCHMKLGEFSQAEKLLKKALEKNPIDPMTNSNLVTALSKSGFNSNIFKKQVATLLSLREKTPLIEQYLKLEHEFDQFAEQFNN
ncbi:coatomer subunit epsilon [Anaeramoeba flamelloides]|uniref:Coatomer subunit epsilon n=1 Tax=Anaeramoeba flamelloides TaxID=1746091 RepID=A0ABQ8XRI1_9EUKA|nr:coatomer subunit epsilon [Anaeramoeba flamelloides]